jgi:hypothetical protein
MTRWRSARSRSARCCTISAPGACHVLDILRGGIDSALLGLGKASIRDLTPSDLVIPPEFTRTLGGDRPVIDTTSDGQAPTGEDVVLCPPGQVRRAEGASRPRARARATASPRRCVPSFA